MVVIVCTIGTVYPIIFVSTITSEATRSTYSRLLKEISVKVMVMHGGHRLYNWERIYIINPCVVHYYLVYDTGTGSFNP
jgi:hypothetical protein